MAQNYVIVQRVLTPGVTVMTDGGRPAAQNASEFVAYLNEQYLSQGYEIHTISQVPVPADAPANSTQYAYHLIKVLPEAKSK